tara:strand:- start:3378 stop:4265 length:888 start_codon:yes stop_codon:yes gene_type:complete
MGTVIISFDCEGKWGMLDSHAEWHKLLTNDNLIGIYNYILEVMEYYNLPATFAFVGALTETKENLFKRLNGTKMGDAHSKWFRYAKQKIEKNDEGWFVPKLLDLVKNNRKHEIASHSYSHISFTNIQKKDAEIEFDLVGQWKKRNHLSCSSFVFPRNQIRYADLLYSIGVNRYRGKPNNFSMPILGNSINNFIEEVLIYKKSEDRIIKDNKIPGGVFINWPYGYRKFISSKLSSFKYNSMIDDAKKNNKCAHFWIHPHNLLSAPKAKDIFENLCSSISLKMNYGDLTVQRMIDFK